MSARNGHAPAVRQSLLVDHLGRPMAYALYPSARGQTRSYRPRTFLHPDTKVNVGQADREEAVNYCRQLFAQTDTLNAAVNQKNAWAFGDAWDYHYTGANVGWRQEVENFVNNQWYPNCNVRGPIYDFKTSWNLSGIHHDIDGDDAMVLTATDAGFPQIAFYPATKITSRAEYGYGGGYGTRSDTVSEGEYSGARIFDGIIYDRHSRMIALRIAGEKNGEFTDISSYNADLSYEPQFHDQGRGWPKAWTGMLKWLDLDDIDAFLRRGVKLGACYPIIEHNEEGEAPTGNEVMIGDERPADGSTTLDGGLASDRKVAFEEINGGEVRYLSAPAGEKIESLTYQNPHPNVETFIERITRGTLASIGWHIELMDLSSTGRAPSRILCDLANQSIWMRQKTGLRRARRAIGYAIALGMKNGFISRNDDGHDAYMMELGLPKPITVDSGNEQAADREALKLGITNKAILWQKYHGMSYRDGSKQRAMELSETIEEALALSKKHQEISFDRALELLEQRSPNPIAQLPKTQDKQTQQASQQKKAP